MFDGPFPGNSNIPELPYTKFSDVSNNGIVAFYSETLTPAPDFKNIYVTGLYDTRKGDYSILGSGEYVGFDVINQTGFDPYGINAPGALVGGEGCAIIDKKGNVTQPIPPGYATAARGVSANGTIVGVYYPEDGFGKGLLLSPQLHGKGK